MVGTGNVGAALGSAFARAGHEVTYGARSPESDSARAAVERTPRSRALSLSDAAMGAEIVVLAVPWPAVSSAVAALGDLSGPIVVDATNPLRADLSGLSVQGDNSAGEQIAAVLPDARVVKGVQYDRSVEPRRIGLSRRRVGDAGLRRRHGRQGDCCWACAGHRL
ncbi:MAG: NADPH-dependent F420 reductase [Trebonia sp.]